MDRVSCRWLMWATACAFLTACSTTPTSPSIAQAGPIIPQDPLTTLIASEPPPAPPRLAAPMPAALGASLFVAFGDSITYGTLSRYDAGMVFAYDDPLHSYPVRLKLGLDAYHGPRAYTVLNEGLPAERASQGALRIQSVLASHRPQGLLLLEGINDLGVSSIAATVNALEAIVNTARANNVTVLVATMPQTYETTNPVTGEYRDNSKDLIVAFNNAIRARFAGRQNVYVVDLWTAFGTDHRYMGADGLHPNEAGYELMASVFLRAIEQVFAIRGSFQ